MALPADDLAEYTLEFQIYYIATTYSIAFYLFLDDETRFSVNS